MKSMHKLGITVAVLAAFVLAVGSARGQSPTNYWIGTTDPDFNQATNWSAGVPTSTQFAAFTNVNSATPVTLSGNAVDYGLLMFDNASITFNLSGNVWSNNPAAVWNTSLPDVFISNSTPGVVKISSQGSTGTFTASGAASMLGLSSTTKLIIDDSLGAPAVVSLSLGHQYYLSPRSGLFADLVVSGPGSQFKATQVALNPGFMGSAVISNQGLVSLDVFYYGGTRGDFPPHPAMAVTTTVINASLTTGSGVGYSAIGGGYMYPATVILSNNATWTDSGTLTVGAGWDGVVDYQGKLLMNQSTYVGQELTIGALVAVHNGPGYVEVANNSTMILSNGYALVSDKNYNGYTNTLVIGNSTLKLGKPGVNGVLTNRGIMKASGTITGLGSGPALVRSERSLEIGSSIGTLTLDNASLELAAGSETLFEFSDTGLDQIILNGGSASVLGSNLFSLASGSAVPTAGVKWGLGAYNFIVGSNVTWNPQYDDLTNVLAGYGLTQGLDYNYGIFNLDGGLQALRLEFVPEPSTVLLLLGGGLLVWRSRRKQ